MISTGAMVIKGDPGGSVGGIMKMPDDNSGSTFAIIFPTVFLLSIGQMIVLIQIFFLKIINIIFRWKNKLRFVSL